VSGLDSIGAVTGGTRSASSAPRRDELNQDSFLQLMIAQLQNQDPFKPLDPTQYVSQLAQFSSVSGLQAIQSSIGGLVESMRGNQVLDGATLVGRSVLAEGSRVRLTATAAGGFSARGAVQVPEGVTQVLVTVRDATGQLVRTAMVEARAGTQEFSWDGRQNDGSLSPAGDYSVEAFARSGGDTIALETQVAARVTSVSIDPRSNALSLNTDTLGALPLSAVRRVM
jgi:flagellar basal-body rod modification protein FlgD